VAFRDLSLRLRNGTEGTPYEFDKLFEQAKIEKL